MRLRNAALAVASAAALVLAVPMSANAAEGDFLYKVGPRPGVLTGLADPQSGVCIDLPDTGFEPGYAPENLTKSSATVFLEAHCDGDVFYTLNPGKKAGDRLHMRSVVFS